MAGTRIQDAALDAVGRGWPVVPGARRTDRMGFDVVYPATGGKGEWVALPPTTVGYAPVRWMVAPPDDRDAALPDADRMQRVLADALTSELRDGDRD